MSEISSLVDAISRFDAQYRSILVTMLHIQKASVLIEILAKSMEEIRVDDSGFCLKTLGMRYQRQKELFLYLISEESGDVFSKYFERVSLVEDKPSVTTFLCPVDEQSGGSASFSSTTSFPCLASSCLD